MLELLLVILALCPGAAALGPHSSSSGGAARAGLHHRIAHSSFVSDSSNSKQLVAVDPKRLEPRGEYRASTSIPAMLAASLSKQALNLMSEWLRWTSIVAPVCFLVHLLPFVSYFPSVAAEHIPMMKLGLVTGITIALIVADGATKTSNAVITSFGGLSNSLTTSSENLSNGMIKSSENLSNGSKDFALIIGAAMVVVALVIRDGIKNER